MIGVSALWLLPASMLAIGVGEIARVFRGGFWGAVWGAAAGVGFLLGVWSFQHNVRIF